MLLRTIGLFIVAGIITVVSSKLFHIATKDIVILSTVLAPLGLLQTRLTKLKRDFINTGSLFFTKHNWLFQWSFRLFAIALILGLYFYGKMNGIWTTLIFFVVSSIVQSAYYALLKLTIPGEVVLLPIEIVGLILFYSFVV